MKTLSAPVKL